MITQCDALTFLQSLESDSLDAIVTDPPYGLSKEPDAAEVLRHWLAGDDYKHTGRGFMGKEWDSFVPGPAIWREAHRVLKPGGHLVCFAGSRTYDLMCMAVRLAGFEVRDQLLWLYGTGFPKSVDITRAIDRQDARDAQLQRRLKFTEWLRSTGITRALIDEVTDSNMGSHYLTSASQPAIPVRAHFEAIKSLLFVDVPGWVEAMVDERTVESENLKNRPVVQEGATNGLGNGAFHKEALGAGGYGYSAEFDRTGAATDEAKQWQGWGTALKPAHEPIVLARKKPEGTLAENVVKWGCGALNIDGCRVEGGRFPANLIHSGQECVVEVLDGAAKYFYCAKASRAERDQWLDHLPATTGGEATGRQDDSAGTNSPRAGAGRTGGARNFHPTVKPLALMRHLVRLVTPKGGQLADPFAGSGTTLVAGILECVNVQGCDLTAEYIPIIEAKILGALLND